MSNLKDLIIHGSQHVQWVNRVSHQGEFVNIKNMAGKVHRHLLTSVDNVGCWGDIWVSINLTHSRRICVSDSLSITSPFRFTTYANPLINSYVSPPVLIKKGSIEEFIVRPNTSLDLTWVDPILSDLQPLMIALPHLFTFVTCDGFSDVTLLQPDAVIDWLNLVSEDQPLEVEFLQPGKKLRNELLSDPKMILSDTSLDIVKDLKWYDPNPIQDKRTNVIL